MSNRLSHQFLRNYLLAFLLSIAAALGVVALLSLADRVLSARLVKNLYPASALMREDPAQIEASGVVENGGGLQVVSRDLEIIRSEGLSLLGREPLTMERFTDFLAQSKAVDSAYHMDVQYNSIGEFWLIVSFPTSIRLHLGIVVNREAASRDMGAVAAVFAGGLALYLLLLALFAFLFSKATSIRIIRPLQKLCEGTRRLREGDYTARVHLRLKNEFAELQDTFNDMAQRIEAEMALRRQSEANRKRLILDISHDLRNPLASILGYAEHCLQRPERLQPDQAEALRVIRQNGQRANQLLSDLFELSKVESPAFTLNPSNVEVCEGLRRLCAELLPALEQAGFAYDFDIPEETAYVSLDLPQMGRVFHNLAENAVRYNERGVTVTVRLTLEADRVVILFEDDGVGVPASIAQDIFKPFVRSGAVRGPQPGGAGLGLSIAQKIVNAHGGTIELHAKDGPGCAFAITLPRI